jgi:hypothetical protein
MTDIFEFWSRIGWGEFMHPADKVVFSRMNPEKHGFRLDCLPACFGGPLRTAHVVLLYLSPGFTEQDVADAETDETKNYYARRWKGEEPLRSVDGLGTAWVASRTRSFGSWTTIRDKVAILNIGAYHSRDVKSYGALLALPSSRVALEWAQSVLFPDAEAGKRIVICMRSASYWGLEQGRRYHGALFAPYVNRSGHLINNDEKHRLIELIQDRIGAKAEPTTG